SGALERATRSGTRASAHTCRHESKRLSKKGKPPGGDPAAPVRRRSCRGAGSATAGARLLMWELQALSARVVHIGLASVGAARTPVMAHTVAVTSTAITSTEPFPVGSAQAVENRKAPLLILVQA